MLILIFPARFDFILPIFVPSTNTLYSVSGSSSTVIELSYQPSTMKLISLSVFFISVTTVPGTDS